MNLLTLYIISTGIFSGNNIASIAGWAGTVSYILAYVLLSINKIRSDQKIYHLLNIIGAVGLVYYAIYINSMPNLLVNAVWGVIGIVAIVHIIWKKK